jgi:hypothetical protein
MSGHNDEPSEPASPAVSVYSLTPSIREASFVTMHGRLVNNRSDVYRFPADAEEVVRLGEYFMNILHVFSYELFIQRRNTKC